MLGFVSILGSGVEETIKHSKEIEKSFKKASSFVSSFREKHERLPTKTEFEEWRKTFPDKPYGPKGMRLLTASFPDEAVKIFGVAPEGSFLLVYWRGEWDEYFASWGSKTSLELDESKYYFFGIKYLDGISCIVLALLVFIGCIKIWPNQTFQRTGRSAAPPTR